MCYVVGEGGWGWVYELQSVIVTESDESIRFPNMIRSSPWSLGLGG